MPTFQRAEPQLFVADLNASLTFFSDTLGFSVEMVFGDPPFYGQVRRGKARLNLRTLDVPVIDPVLREREQLLSATIAIDDACSDFAQPLRIEPWGALTFIVRDPDGNLILFAGRKSAV